MSSGRLDVSWLRSRHEGRVWLTGALLLGDAMTATELIARLQGLVALHGDVDVVIDDGQGPNGVFGVFGQSDCIVIDETANSEDK